MEAVDFCETLITIYRTTWFTCQKAAIRISFHIKIKLGGIWRRVVWQGRENVGSRLLWNVDTYLPHYVVHMPEGSNSHIFSYFNVFVFNLHIQMYVQSVRSTNVIKSPACFGTFRVSSSGSPHSCRPNMGWAGLNPYLGFESVSEWPLVSNDDCRAATGSLHVAWWNILSSVLKFVLDIHVF
jgi:hypothetical protein